MRQDTKRFLLYAYFVPVVRMMQGHLQYPYKVMAGSMTVRHSKILWILNTLLRSLTTSKSNVLIVSLCLKIRHHGKAVSRRNPVSARALR